MEISQRIKLFNEHGQAVTVGYMVADIINKRHYNFVSIGVSVCNPEDEFKLFKAKFIARKRQKNYLKSYQIKNRKDKPIGELRRSNDPYYADIYNQIDEFIFRCHRYYKDKMVCIPKIEFT